MEWARVRVFHNLTLSCCLLFEFNCKSCKEKTICFLKSLSVDLHIHTDIKKVSRGIYHLSLGSCTTLKGCDKLVIFNILFTYLRENKRWAILVHCCKRWNTNISTAIMCFDSTKPMPNWSIQPRPCPNI